MAAGDADAFFAALLANDPDSHSSMTSLATDVAKALAFLRGMRNCAEGNPFSDTSSSHARQAGYKAAQAGGVSSWYNVWP
jgi:hypothetical protein